MPSLRRSLLSALEESLSRERQMAFVVGPRQVGKTAVSRSLTHSIYLNWDDDDDRDCIVRGPASVADRAGLDTLAATKPVLVFDELHKYRRWRTFLKGFYDRYVDVVRIVVTGSSRLDFYRKGGDSLMGRYFVHRLHPLSVGELLAPSTPVDLLRDPARLDDARWARLCLRGGFPEPFLQDDARFSTRWQRMRREQLVRGDIRDLTRIQEVDQLAMLVRVLATRSGTQINFAGLARELRTAGDTMRRWVDALCSLYHGFLVRPWYRNVARSLRKEPKWFLRDWST